MNTKCINCGKKQGLFSKKITLIEEVYVCSEECKREVLKKAEMEFEEDIKKIKENGKEYLCNNCEYKWESKKRFGEPASCPKCKKQDIEKYARTKKWEEDYRKYRQNHIRNILECMEDNRED